MTYQQHTIDVGIDLGTTNSAVAVMVDGKPLVIPNAATQLPTTPSVVRLRANGALDVGKRAYDFLGSLPGDVHGEFKRAMGDSSARFRFEAAGETRTPQQLSAEVLKVLRASVEQHLGFTPASAVITVPAAFDLKQCAATQEAAELAGLADAPLLQEPVAASLAYGYAMDVSSGQWLVYDLGGGTFDLALVGVRDGRIQVLDHEGDNFLGGKDFDWLIVEQILVPRLARSYDVSSFRRGNAARTGPLAILKAKAEELKIALSAAPSQTVTVEGGGKPLEDDRGAIIEEDITVTRAEYERLIAEPVARTIAMCRKVLQRNPGITPESILLVGGPTLTPYVRQALADGLGIRVNTSANAMTAVAEGATVFAATQPMRGKATTARAAAPAGAVAAQVKHAAVTEDTETPVGISVAAGAAESVQVAAADGSWRSGQLPLRNGAAVLRVPLLGRGANPFTLALRDASGAAVPCEPSSFVIHRGLTAAEPPLSRSIGVVHRDEGSGRRAVEWLLKKGTPLPARANHEFRTTLALEPGGELEVIDVIIVEGEANRAERNRIVGHISISDRDVDRRIPAGSPVEVRLEVSASRLLKAQVFLLQTDQVFDVPVRLETERTTAAALTSALLAERRRIDTLAGHATGAQVTGFNRQADAVATAVRAVSEQDPGSEQQALNALKALQEELDTADEAVEIPVAIAEGRDAMDFARQVISAHGSESQQRRIEALGQELSDVSAARDLAAIERATQKVLRLAFEVLAAQPWFWRDWFDRLSTTVTAWREPAEADRLVREGTNAIRNGDISTLRRTTLALSDQAPQEEGSFANVGLRRG